jgi:hypothetical protein
VHVLSVTGDGKTSIVRVLNVKGKAAASPFRVGIMHRIAAFYLQVGARAIWSSPWSPPSRSFLGTPAAGIRNRTRLGRNAKELVIRLGRILMAVQRHQLLADRGNTVGYGGRFRRFHVATAMIVVGYRGW